MKKTPSPAPTPHYVNADALAAGIGLSKRKAAQLRHEPWFPPAVVLGPRSLRWDLNEVLRAIQRHAPRTRVGAEPAQLSTSRNRAAG